MALPLAALAAMAAMSSYSRDAEAAKFSWMSPERIRKLLDFSAYGNDGQKAKSAMTMVKPSEMINATTTGPEHRANLVKESGRYDPLRQQRHDQRAYLSIDSDKRSILEHEGRHRMTALQTATGRDDPVPYELMTTGNMNIPEWQALQGQKLKGQKYYKEPIGKSFTPREITPLAYDIPEDELMRYATQVDIPLKNVSFNLRPEGKNVTKDDISAYLYGSVPYGKIPPPEERFTHPLEVFKGEEYTNLLERYQAIEGERPDFARWARQFYPPGIK